MESSSMAVTYASHAAGCSGCSSVASREAAARISRFRRPTSACEYFAAITSPCSVTRICPCTAPAADGSAAAVEETQRDPMTAERVDERDFRLVEFPARGQEPTVLVAIGVTEHHLLGAITTLQEAEVLRHGEEFVHYAAAVAQIRDGLEQRHNVHVERALRRPQQSCLLEQQRYLEKVRDPVRLRDHVVGHRGLAITPVRFGGRAQDRQLRGRLRGIA